MITQIPIPDDESSRLRALERYRILDTEAEERFDRITRLAAAYFKVPIALVSLVDETRQWFKSRQGLDVQETPREIAFCAYTICKDETMIIHDATKDPRFVDSPLLLNDPNIRFYAGAPLRTGDGNNIGTLCVIDTVPRDFTTEQQRVLEDLSGLVIDQLELRLANLLAEEDLKRSAKNIVSLRDNQARLNAIFNSTLDGILIFDKNGCVESHNTAAEQLFGYSSSELMGMHAKTMMPESFDEQATKFFKNYTELGTDKMLLGSDQSLYGVKNNGDKFPMELSLSETSLKNEVFYTVVIRDMTEHRRSERSLLTAIASAEKLRKAQSNLLFRVSHVLKTPLNAIMGFGDILQMDLEQTLSAAQKEHFDLLLSSGKQLNSLIEEILDYTRIESKDILLKIEPLQLGPIIIDCWKQIEPRSRSKNIQFVFNQDQSESFIAYADKENLEQVLTQIFSNAVKFNKPAGKISITISQDSNNLLTIAITDQGAGIKTEDRERIFEVMARSSENEYTTVGTGIGLALCKAMMSSMQGEISVTSSPGLGSTFYLTLPAVRKLLDADQITNSDLRVEADQSATIPTRKKILYIEDDASNLRLVESLLATRQDLLLITAMRGELGYALALQHKPDLILLDTQLPDRDGYEILQKLHSNSSTAHIPVIIVSAEASPKQIEKFIKAGVVDFLTKPYSIKPFMDSVNSALD